MTNVVGKTVLITGAASGIGKLMASALGKKGAHIVLWDYNEKLLNETLDELKKDIPSVRGYVVDLTNKNAVSKTAEKTLKDVIRVDILINNAGIVVGKSLLDASDDEILRTFDVNTLALFWMVRAFLPGMLERDEGHIVTIASAAGIAGTAKLVDYCSSKFAAVGFDEALRVELRRQNSSIKTTVVCPFYIDTGMFDGVKSRFPLVLPILKPEYVVKRIVQAIRHNKQRLVMPRLVGVLYPARLLPMPAFDALQRFFGISSTMDEFVGRGESVVPPKKSRKSKNPQEKSKVAKAS